MKRAALLIGFLLLWQGMAHAEDLIDLRAIMKIESHGDVKAFNRHSGARGLYQVTPIVVKEWNAFHPEERFTNEDMFNAQRNYKVAEWYLNTRIPQMLRHFGKPVNVENVLISYNAGISYVVKGKELPEETSNYLQKYEAEVREM